MRVGTNILGVNTHHRRMWEVTWRCLKKIGVGEHTLLGKCVHRVRRITRKSLTETHVYTFGGIPLWQVRIHWSKNESHFSLPSFRSCENGMCWEDNKVPGGSVGIVYSSYHLASLIHTVLNHPFPKIVSLSAYLAWTLSVHFCPWRHQMFKYSAEVQHSGLTLLREGVALPEENNHHLHSSGSR